MRRFLIAIVLLVGVPQYALALDTIVDQEHLASTSIGYILDYPGDYMAQTFTVRNTGKLTSVEVQVGLSGYSHYSPVTDDLLMRVIATDASGNPDIDQVLASHLIPRTHPALASRDEMIPVDLSSLDLQVSAGDTLAIALSSDHTYYDENGTRRRDEYDYVWMLRTRNSHPGGDFYLYSLNLFGPEPWHWMDNYDPPDNTRDMGFRVFVEVPEPAAWLLALLGLGGLMNGRGWR